MDIDALWKSEYEPRYAALPTGRRKATIEALKQLIKDMYESGMKVIEIGKFLGKDHTTIVHHLQQMEIDGTVNYQVARAEHSIGQLRIKRQATERRAQILIELEQERAALKKDQEELRAIKEQRRLLKRARAQDWYRQKAKRDVIREQVVRLYNEGLTPTQIQERLDMPYLHVVTNILRSSTNYKSLGRTRAKKVEQIDHRTGNVIATFNSFREAGIAMGDENRAPGICAVANGKGHTAYGFKWAKVES